MCFAKVSHKWIPDANERTALKLAGLGEKKFSVFVYGTSSELQDDLFREFPKLASGGGYELLRAPEAGRRELVVTDMPHDGYSVECLQAVVKSAKLYIRPLQRDLDMSPLMKEVGLKVVIVIPIYFHLLFNLYIRVIWWKKSVLVVGCLFTEGPFGTMWIVF